MRPWCVFAVLLALSLHPVDAAARTISVTKDGSGEFAIIQDALDVAQPGDTIQVGPGLFADVRRYNLPSGSWYVCMRPRVAGLTIRGAGAGLTLVGFATPTPTLNGLPTAVVGIPAGITGFEFSGVCFQNGDQLVDLAEGAHFLDCRFHDPDDFAVGLVDADGAEFGRCSFDGNGGEYILGFVGGHNPNLLVEDCTFIGPNASAINISGADNLRVERCQFGGILDGFSMSAGILIHSTAGATIRDCTFEGVRNTALDVEDNSDLDLENCDLGPTLLETLVVTAGSRVVGTHNRIRGGGVATVSTNGGVEIRLSGGDILNGGGLSVQVRSSAAYTPAIDLRDNYWGTTDASQIAAWIQDGNDPPPPVCYYCPAAIVQYEPILQGTVPEAETSFGSLKARFGGENQ